MPELPGDFGTWLGAGIACLSYGFIAVIGGIQGFVRKGSKPSLIAGSISGLLLIACAVGDVFLREWYVPLSAIIVSLLLVGRFVGTLMKERRSGGLFQTPLGRIAVSMVVLGLVTASLNAVALLIALPHGG